MKDELFKRIKKVQSDSSLHDFGGGSPIDKCYLMAYLAKNLNLKSYVEIGVYKGRSLFSVAEAFRSTGGKAYGIDPYITSEAIQHETKEDIRDHVNDFIESLDFEGIYQCVLKKREDFDQKNIVEIIRKTSIEAAKDFTGKTIDMLHIDGNHDYGHVKEDFENYAPLVSEGGLIVFDDIDWQSVRAFYDEIANDYLLIFESETFAILMKREINAKSIDFANNQKIKLNNIYKRIQEKNLSSTLKPTIAVGVLAYNHEKYISECLQSIVSQTGNFNLKIVICDDCSSDNTSKIIEDFLAAHSTDNLEIEYLPSTTNLGMTKNLQRLVRACQHSDYVALIDGDDYWICDYKLQIHIDFLSSHPECAMSFDSILMNWENSGKKELYSLQQETKKETFNTEDIINEYVIGNISCCVYNSQVLRELPDTIFDIFTGDWMLNMACSQLGDIGFVKNIMTTYRKHDHGIWSGMDEYSKQVKAINFIHDYNKYFNYIYDYQFSKKIHDCSSRVDGKAIQRYDLVVIDDIFPHPVSGFRYQEITSLLEHFDSSKALTSGVSAFVLGKQSIEELIINFKRKYPDISNKLDKFSSLDNIDCTLLYFVFLGNAYTYVELAESRGIPFVFTLYPGGLFGINNKKSDALLRRVTQSPCFRKVIVSQKNTYDYLIEKEFCTPDQIEYIFGVVTPLDKIEATYTDKKHFGYDKETLDICFVAHKYTSHGQDKGYDIFVETAHALAKKHNNIKFHVVGNFDESIIDVSEIADKISFYGINQPEWLVEFYKDKDIILSANINGMIYEGSFDGFPTASCTDASLCKTAIFCTDPLNLNNGNYTDGKNIVIIEHDSNKIIGTIEHYYNNPNELKSICENGCLATKRLYSFDSQIKPRLELLEKEINTVKNITIHVPTGLTSKRAIVRKLISICPRKIKTAIKNSIVICPKPIKNIIKKVLLTLGIDYRTLL